MNFEQITVGGYLDLRGNSPPPGEMARALPSPARGAGGTTPGRLDSDYTMPRARVPMSYRASEMTHYN
jgi:hypothetical protein